jgi:CO dehydrogenase/acetyl-CoA synthase delta subunit
VKEFQLITYYIIEREIEQKEKSMKVSKKVVDEIVKVAFPEYKGKKYNLEFVEKVEFYDTNWSGGTRNKYVVLRADGKQFNFNEPAPWVNNVEGQKFDLNESVVVVCHSYFCGKDCGVTVYACPSVAARLLPSPASELVKSYGLIQEVVKA